MRSARRKRPASVKLAISVALLLVLTAAATLAYTVGCPLVAVDTFAVIADPSLAAGVKVDVIADAQQDKIYVQRFGPGDREELRIVPFTAWLERTAA